LIFVTNIVTNSFKKIFVSSEFDFFLFRSKFSKLNLTKEDLTEIPVEVLELDFLEEFNLSENQVRKISEHMGKLENLTELNLGFNQISEIPSHILNFAEWCSMPVVPSVFLKKK